MTRTCRKIAAQSLVFLIVCTAAVVSIAFFLFVLGVLT